MTAKRLVGCLVLGLVLVQSAHARVTSAEYRDVGVSVLPGTAAPLSAVLTDEHGQRLTLRELIDRPTVLVFADYTCRTLCGPIVAFVAAALENSGLQPGKQFELVVIGLDPKDSAASAAQMRRAELGDNAALNAAARFVTADEQTIKTLTAALGYRYYYDEEDDQYIHPAAAYVLRADGAVARVLAGLGPSGDDLRLALVEAGEGRIGTLRDQIRLLCSGFDPAHGTYNVMVSRMLTLVGLGTLLLLGSGIGALLLMGRRRPA